MTKKQEVGKWVRSQPWFKKDTEDDKREHARKLLQETEEARRGEQARSLPLPKPWERDANMVSKERMELDMDNIHNTRGNGGEYEGGLQDHEESGSSINEVLDKSIEE